MTKLVLARARLRAGARSTGRSRRWPLALIVVLLGVTACRPAASQTQTTVVVGDSITWQAQQSGAFDGLDWDVVTYPGYQAEHAVPYVRLRLSDLPIDRLVVLLGTNDAGGPDGWNEDDEDIWSELFGLVPASTCIVVVKPFVTAAAAEAQRAEFPGFAYLDAIVETNGWIDQAASTWPNVWAVDWEPYAQRPNVLAEGGVHLQGLHAADSADGASTVTTDAAAARREVIEAGLDHCGEATLR